MAYYVIEYRYNPELKTLVRDARPAHRSFLRNLESTGVIIGAGFFKDVSFDGGMAIMRADSAVEAETLFSQDPFMVAGLLEDVRIRQWIPTIGRLAANFDTEFPIS